MTYFADAFMLMLTDTTERSPTFMLPPYRRIDDNHLVNGHSVRIPFKTQEAWHEMLRRPPRSNLGRRCIASLAPVSIQATAEAGQSEPTNFRLATSRIRRGPMPRFSCGCAWGGRGRQAGMGDDGRLYQGYGKIAL